MKVEENKKVQKELKKLPPHIQKKYMLLLSELKSIKNLYDLNPKWAMKKMDYNPNVFRAKLDLSYRIGLVKNQTTGGFDIEKVSSREDFNYIGSKN